MFQNIMKTKILSGILLIASFLFLYSCEKEINCDKSTGYIEIRNHTENPYNVYIDSIWYKQLNKWDTVVYELPAKWYHLRFVQIWGFDSIPYIYNTSVAVDACSYTACNVFE